MLGNTPSSYERLTYISDAMAAAGARGASARRIAKLREDRGWTQQQLADRTKGVVTKDDVGRMETARTAPRNMAKLAAIAKVFGTTSEDLLQGSPTRPRSIEAIVGDMDLTPEVTRDVVAYIRFRAAQRRG